MSNAARTLACILACCGAAALAADQTFAPPTSLNASDCPDDAGGKICVTWPCSPSESAEWDYVLFAATATAGPWKAIQRFPSTARLRSDLPSIYGFDKANHQWHATKVSRAEVFEPQDIIKLRANAHQAAAKLRALATCQNARRSIDRLIRRRGSLDALQKRLAALDAQIKNMGGTKAARPRLEALRNTLQADAAKWTKLNKAIEQAKQTYRKLANQDIESIADVAAEMGRLAHTRRDAEQAIKLASRTADLRACCFRLGAVRRGSTQPPKPFPALVAWAAARPNWFNRSDANTFVGMIALSLVILGSIAVAQRKELYLRKIAGLDAVDEALGRCTEMGKPALFVHGLTGVSDISVLASVNILGRMARRVAEFDTGLLVVNNDPVVYSLSTEVVREGYVEAGRPDRFRDDHIFMVASRQFPYVAAVAGIMARERPAANFFMGYFFAESLILAEAGAATGAIQIAGTDAFTQLPFFVTTCDYTLMGEELYAASAYLSRERKLLGTLRGQDVGKALLMIALIVGTVWVSLGSEWFVNLFKTF